MTYTNDTNVINNTIQTCNNGIALEAGMNNSLKSNNIVDNDEYAIRIDNYYSSTLKNSICWNNFISNNKNGISQAYDEGVLNTFTDNYWDDHSTPDSNDDGVVDNPYSIEGVASNNDPNPLVSKHQISKITVLYPNGGETLTGNITIQWNEVTDSHDHSISFEIWYSSDNGIIWRKLVARLLTTSYEWNTQTLYTGSEYLVKVIAICSEGTTSKDTSDNVFRIETPLLLSTSSTTESSSTEFSSTDSTSTFVWIFPFLIALFVLVFRRKQVKSI